VNDLAIGVVGGLLTAFVLFLGRHFLVTTILPWWRATMYDGVSVDGEWVWKGVTPSGTKHTGTLQLTQRGKAIVGTLKVVVTSENWRGPPEETYYLRGEIHGSAIALLGADEKKGRMNPIVMMLTTDAGDYELKGAWTWLSMSSGGLVHHMDILPERRGQGAKRAA
jgi:hypothetical protein